MLRTIKHPHLLPRLHGFKFTTTAAPAATLDIGSQEATIARAAAGKATITPAQYGAREGAVIVTPGADTVAGGYGVYDTTHAGSSFKAEMLNLAAGAGDDGTGFALAVNYADTEDDRQRPLQSVKNPCIAPRLLAFKLSAAGAVTIGGAQGVDTLAFNVHTIAFTNPFSRAPIVVASPIDAAAQRVRVTANAVGSVSIEGYDVTGFGLADVAAYVAVLGWDSPDTMSDSWRSVKTPQVQPRIEVFRIDGVGAANLGLGSSDGTLVDNGAGDYSVTFLEPFAREPIVLVTGKDYQAQLLADATTTGFQVGCFSNAGVATDDEVYAVVIGFDGEDDA
jgi:hypothetical protein